MRLIKSALLYAFRRFCKKGNANLVSFLSLFSCVSRSFYACAISLIRFITLLVLHSDVLIDNRACNGNEMRSRE